MKRWEYDTAGAIEPIAGWLTHRSAAGYEFCGIYADPGGGQQFIFRKEVPPADTLTPEAIADNEARIRAMEKRK
jgi:hypothetical protein